MKKVIEKLSWYGLAILLLISVNSSLSQAGQADKEWKIPFLVMLTGHQAGSGGMVKIAVYDAVAQVNAAGGIAGKPVIIKYHDTASNPTKANAEISKVIEDNLIIFGPIAMTSINATLPMVKRHKGFVFAVTSGSIALKNHKPHLINLWSDFNVAIGNTIKGWLKLNPDIKSVVTIVNPKGAMWRAFAKIHRGNLEAAGIKVLPDVQLAPGVDLGSAVISALSKNPDGYTVIATGQECANIIRELDRRGMKEKRRIIFSAPADDPAFYEIGKGYIDGAYLYHAVNRLSKNKRWTGFRDRHRKEYKGADPGFMSIPPYDMVYLAKQAIEDLGLTGEKSKLGEERKKLIEYMQNIKSFKGILDTYDIVDGQAMTPGYLFTFKNNQLEYVGSY